MSLILLIALSHRMGLVGLAAFLWALRDGQFDDPEGSAWRVVAPQDPPGAKGPMPNLSPSRESRPEGHELAP